MASQSQVEETNSSSRTGIQVIARAAQILRVLEGERAGLSLGKIAKRVDLPRSTVQRIVNALAAEQLLIAASPGAGVMLGPAIVRMASNTRFDFPSVVRPHLQSLADATGETVDLSLQRRDRMIFVDQIASRHRLSAVSAVGDTFPTYCSANGKSALALLSDDEIAILLNDHLVEKTPNTLLSLPKLMSEIKVIRGQGFAIDNEEHTEGISAVGTAFHDPTGRTFAVSVPVPTTRFVRSQKAVTDALLSFREKLLLAIHR